MISITVNGKPRDLEGPLDVPRLLETLDIKPERVAVALNGEVVPRSEWPRTTVGDGDSVEVVRAVGGGAHAPAIKKETLMTDALLLLLVFGAGFALAVQILVNGDMGQQRGVTEALLVSVTVTYGCALAVMLLRYLVVGKLNLDTPGAPLLYLLPLLLIAVVAFVGLMGGLQWYHFLGGVAGALIVFSVAYVGPRVGIGATAATLVAGQMTGAILFDHMALLSQAKDPVDAFKVMGAALIVAGVLLVRGF